VRTLEFLLRKSEAGGIWLFTLNLFLHWLIPFNAPHGVNILSISATQVKVGLPFRRRNKNHVGSLHACALATAAEFCAGVALLKALPSKNIRLLMKELKVDYRFRGMSAAKACCEIPPLQLFSELREEGERITHESEVSVVDESGELLCKAHVLWHLKRIPN